MRQRFQLAWIAAWMFLGAAMNASDRWMHGTVTDYLAFHLGAYAWPAIVNIADLAITFSMMAYFIYCKKMSK